MSPPEGWPGPSDSPRSDSSEGGRAGLSPPCTSCRQVGLWAVSSSVTWGPQPQCGDPTLRGPDLMPSTTQGPRSFCRGPRSKAHPEPGQQPAAGLGAQTQGAQHLLRTPHEEEVAALLPRGLPTPSAPTAAAAPPWVTFLGPLGTKERRRSSTTVGPSGLDPEMFHARRQKAEEGGPTGGGTENGGHGRE